MKRLSEDRESVWMLTAAPAIWSAHFLVCYLSGAVYCAKIAGPDGALGPVKWIVAIATAIALAGIVATGAWGYWQHSLGRHDADGPPHDADTPGDRHRFLGFATLLLAGVSALATVYVALPAFLIGSCR